ncbi:MAG: bifunctional 23S rRNA (guanine(2069)-N(7))-methyltransferase RlmK/23S rRNA (guanine(2445)-N(2))-methyltransferase RlmL [Polyangiales bacterium]
MGKARASAGYARRGFRGRQRRAPPYALWRAQGEGRHRRSHARQKGERPDVDVERPDVRVHVRVDGNRAGVSIDVAGALHERGYRPRGADAPLRETLAAAMLMAAGWPTRLLEGDVLLDPMCGSGTILVEGALMALDIAPGLLRRRGAPVRWLGHDAAAWERVRAEAEARRSVAATRIVDVRGSDRSANAVRRAKEAVETAGVGHVVRLETLDFSESHPPDGLRGLIVTNPPYGERLGDEAELGPLYERLGDSLKRHFAGWDAWVLTSSARLAKRVGLRAETRVELWNGPIECRLLHYPIGRAAEAGAEPHWRKPSPESEMFGNRLKKNWKRLRKWAEREGTTCFRIYDADIPEYNVTVDWYDGRVRVEEFEPPRFIAEDVAEQRRTDVFRWVLSVLEVGPDAVVVRMRRRRHDGEQHEKRSETGRTHVVTEAGTRFEVNLDDYLDTGLFLDDRNVRAWVRREAKDRSFLNLFAYTCAASVAACLGGAKKTTSVDLSKVYLAWGRRNFALNGLEADAHAFIADDAFAFLDHTNETFDCILLAPPTYSRSKRTEHDFDIARDHVVLIDRAMRRLTSDGVLLFTTNLRSFELDARLADRYGTREITSETTPADFAKSSPHRAFVIAHGATKVLPRD